MIPRNTLVLVVEITDNEKKTRGGVVIPAGSTTSKQYKKCKVVAVGPGMTNKVDELSLCRDLRPGQLVLAKIAAMQRLDASSVTFPAIGADFTDDDGRDLKLVEQSQIVAIIAEPGDWVEDEPAKPAEKSSLIVTA